MTVETKAASNGEQTEDRIPLNQRQVRATVERALRYERILSELRDLTGDSETEFDDLPDALAKLMADYADAAADASRMASQWRAESERIAAFSDKAYRDWMAKLSNALGDFWQGPTDGRQPQMRDVESSIRRLVARYRARGLVIDALVREVDGLRHKLTGREAPPQSPAGVGKDEPTIVNEKGGKQSKLPYRCDLLPALAILAVSGVLEYGAAKYGDDNWKNIPVVSHLNHLLVHAFAFLADDCSDDHLEHLATRALMALQLHLEAKEDAGRRPGGAS